MIKCFIVNTCLILAITTSGCSDYYTFFLDNQNDHYFQDPQSTASSPNEVFNPDNQSDSSHQHPDDQSKQISSIIKKHLNQKNINDSDNNLDSSPQQIISSNTVTNTESNINNRNNHIETPELEDILSHINDLDVSIDSSLASDSVFNPITSESSTTTIDNQSSEQTNSDDTPTHQSIVSESNPEPESLINPLASVNELLGNSPTTPENSLSQTQPIEVDEQHKQLSSPNFTLENPPLIDPSSNNSEDLIDQQELPPISVPSSSQPPAPPPIDHQPDDQKFDIIFVIDNSNRMHHNNYHHKITTLVDNVIAESIELEIDTNFTVISASSSNDPYCTESTLQPSDSILPIGYYFDYDSDLINRVNCKVNELSPLLVLNKLMIEGELHNKSFDVIFRDQTYKIFFVISDNFAPKQFGQDFTSIVDSTLSNTMTRFFAITPHSLTDGNSMMELNNTDNIINTAQYQIFKDNNQYIGCGSYHTEVYNLLTSYYHGESYDICSNDWQDFAKQLFLVN